MENLGKDPQNEWVTEKDVKYFPPMDSITSYVPIEALHEDGAFDRSSMLLRVVGAKNSMGKIIFYVEVLES